MGNPIFVLAGQSNASAMEDAIVASLTDEFGEDGFILVEAYAAGAPLTYSRSGLDWFEARELPQLMVDNTLVALSADPTNTIEGIIWIQGEADTFGQSLVEAYQEQFEHLMSNFRTSLLEAVGGRETGVETARTVISTLSDNAPAHSSRVNWDEVIEAQEDIAVSDPLVSSVDPDEVAEQNAVAAADMFRDHLHYATSFEPILADALVSAVIGDEVLEPQNHLGTDGADQFVGGVGDDTYYVNDTFDEIVEMRGGGTDEVRSSVSFSLRAHSQHLEALTLTGAGNTNATGNGLDNTITGNDNENLLNGAWGDDTLFGGSGDDTLDGGRGADNLIGGTGNDFYLIDHPLDSIIEYADFGYDHVSSSVSFSLRAHSQDLEYLSLTGSDNLVATGNGQANVIVGNEGNNRLNGAWGNDTLIGGDGDDHMIGGRGDDTYYVDGRGDNVSELEGQGEDHVYSEVSFSLRAHSQNLEFLTLTGSADVAGTGNGLNNVITGNSGENRLHGAWGNDTIIGGRGDDRLSGGRHADTFEVGHGDGNDTVTDFELGVDRLHLSDVAFGEGLDQISHEDFLRENGMVQDGTDLFLDLGDGMSIKLLNVVDEEAVGQDAEDYLDVFL